MFADIQAGRPGHPPGSRLYQESSYGQNKVTEVVITWCSGSEPKTESVPLASGNASGGYAIATAEYTGGDTGNATQAESDAGC